MIQLVEIKISFLRKHFDQIAISKSMIYVMVKIFTISRSNNDGPLSVDCIFFILLPLVLVLLLLSVFKSLLQGTTIIIKLELLIQA